MLHHYAPTSVDEAGARPTAFPSLLTAYSRQECLQLLCSKRSSSRQLSREHDVEGVIGESGADFVLATSGAIADPTQLNPVVGDFVWYPQSEFPFWQIVMANDDGTFKIVHEWKECTEVLDRTITIDRVVAQQALRDQMELEQQSLEEVRKKLHPWLFQEEAAKACWFFTTSIGPAIPLVRLVAFGALITQVAIFVLTRFTTICIHSCELMLPNWVWPAMILVFIGRALAEYQALTYALPTLAREDGFSICKAPVHVFVWILVHFTLSQFSFADIILDSIFTGTSTKMVEFDDTASKIWLECWQQSTLRFFPTPSLRLLLLGSFGLLFVQIVVPIFSTLRRTDLKCTTQHKMRMPGISETLCFGPKLGHGHVFLILADAGCLATLQAMLIPTLGKDFRRFKEYVDDVDSRLYTLSSFASNCKQVATRIFFTLILENAAQLNLQSTLYAISIVTAKLRDTRYHLQTTALLSLGTSILMSLWKLFEVRDIFTLACELKSLTIHDYEEHAQQLKTQIRRHLLMILVGCAILVLSLAYTVVKLIMAHHCDHALWNINGCIRLDL